MNIKGNFDNFVKLVHNGCLNLAENDNPRNNSGVLCDRCGNELTVAYHEDRLYSVHCWRCRIVSLVSAREPREAAERAQGL